MNIALLSSMLKDMNRAFGIGEISDINLKLEECSDNLIVGTVARKIEGQESDTRYFKVENGHLIFLSHKRKVAWRRRVWKWRNWHQTRNCSSRLHSSSF